MKKSLLIITAVLFSFAGFSQKIGTTYRYVVRFYSICCGVPDNAPLLKNIATFKKKNGIKKIAYYRIGPMGKEGEYYMAFNLKELTKKQTLAFIKNVEKVLPTLNDRGNAAGEENMLVEKSSLPSRAEVKKISI